MSKNANQYADDILNAISVISQQNVRDAAFDKTVIATVKSCEDKATGKYIINYKDINQEAYAINADMKYTPGQLVYVLFPGNNSQRVKTIINTVDHVATTSDNIKDTDQLYNEAGPNIINLGEFSKRNILIEGNIIQLYSYRPLELNEFFLYKKGKENNVININPSDYKYLKEGNSIILTADLRTNIDKSRQAYGQYGIEVICNFYDNGQQDKIIQKKYTLSNFDVNGYPYTVITKTNIKNLEDFDSQNFIDIESIQAYCYNFSNIANEPADQRPDIFLYDFAIQGVNRLTDSQLNGYHVNINYSTYGNTIDADENITQILLKGELKIKGNPINQNVNYYWFKQNGTVFKSSSLYSSYGGDGWECLNEKNDNGVFYGLTNNQIRFVDSEQEKEKYNDTILTKVLNQKVLRIKCVAIYDIVQQSGIETIYNSNITNDIYIDSSDKKGTENQVNYYFNNGSPTLTCMTNVEGEKQYSWSIDYGNGNIEKLEQSEDNIINIQDDYQKYLKEYEKVSQHQKGKYQEKNEAIINAWNDIKDKEIIKNEKVFNLNISKIKKSATVRCGVSLANGDNSAYIGTGSITLYNHFEVKDGYSLIIQEGNQVYQYNNDGISPACESIEKPIKIKPLSFALVDPEGHAIPYEQIIANGKVVWCIPNTNTLLIDNNKKDDAQDYNGLTGTDRALAANNTYTLYINKEFLSYSIADTFDYNASNNDIRLYIVYKDMIFDEWTNFTFPKSGDPGTNGTKYYAKIYPVYQKDQEKRRLTADRVYIDSLSNHYDSEGQPWNKVEAVLYNGSIETGNEPSFWSCPIAPSAVSENALDRSNTSHFQINNNNQIILSSESPFETRLDIIRAQFGTGEQIKYFAEMPICYVYTIGQGNAARYRIKVKEKTGYTYVIYAEDGTNPTHENSDTFELVVEKYNIEQEVYIEQDYDNYTWSVEGNLEIVTTEKNIATIKPLDKFDGKIRKNIITCSIDVGQQDSIIIYIPVYMLINRYGHSALNDWDGNSIDLGNDNGGTILAPQVGAGKKNSTNDTFNNTFTGLLMGQVKYPNKEETEVGLFGYDKGQRTIFLDAQTGKAEFGKNGSGKIIIDPSKIINGKEAALLYSNNFDEQKYRTNNGKLKDNNGEYITYQVNTNDQSGMMIDLTTPQIVFANGKFSVDKQGNLHSASGQIGGWQITPHTLQSTYENKGKVYLNSDGSKVSNKAIKIDSSTKEEIFTVDYAGNLHSEAGDIGGWNISSTSLSNDNVGMQALSGASQKAFYAGAEIDSETHDRPFYVTNNGYLKSSSGKIASWNISTSSLSNNNVGMGERSFGSSNPFTNSDIDARFWAGSGTAAAKLNFAIDSEGTLYSKLGKIGGWNISEDGLSVGSYGKEAGGLQIKSDGSIVGGNNKYLWSIGDNGNASFQNIDASGGKIGNWFIIDGAIQNAETNPTLSLSSNGTITGNNGFIGGIKIDSGGLYTDNWRISSNGNAYFNNLTGLSGNAGGGTLTNGTLSGYTASPGDFYTGGVGNQTYDKYIDGKIEASTVAVKDMFTLNDVVATWRHIDVYLSFNISTKTIGGESITYVTGGSISTTAPSVDSVPSFGITYLGFGGRPA